MNIKMLLLVVLAVSVLSNEVFAARYVDLTQSTSLLSRAERGVDHLGLEKGILPDKAKLKEKDVMVTAQGTKVRKFQETFRDIPVYNTIVDIEEIPQGGTNVHVGDVYADLDEDLEHQFMCQLSNVEAVRIAFKHAGMNGGKVTAKHFSKIIYVDDEGTATLSNQVDLNVVDQDGDAHRQVTWIGLCEKSVLQHYDQAGHRSVIRSASESSTESWGTFETSETTSQFTSGTTPPSTSKTASTVTQDFKTVVTNIGTSFTDASTQSQSTTYATDSPEMPKPSMDCDVKSKAGNPKRTFFLGEKPHCLELIRNGDECILENTHVKGVDLKQTEDDEITDVVKFPCSKGYKDAVNGGFAPLFEAYYFATQTAKMYPAYFNNYSPFKETMYVKAHYGKNYENAFYDGMSMGFGDGDGKETYPWTNLDTVAHEMGHLIVDKSSELIYKNQPGAINEAYSDMVGEVAEAYVFRSPDMLVGWDVFIQKDQALRYFDDPQRDGHSIDHVRDYTEGMDVHYSSGIYNHVFYLMTKDLGVGGALECFVNANRLYWKPTTDFEKGACGTLQGAYDAGLDMDAVAKSFKVVGITMKSCKPLEQYVTAPLTPGTTQGNLRISSVHNPLFKVDVSGGSKKITARITQGYNVAISTSYKRSASVLASGHFTVVADIPGDVDTLYIRAFAPQGKENIKDAMINITLE